MLRCPDSAAVSRGTHLARLAAGWAGCAGCPHATDLTDAPTALRRRLERRAPAVARDPTGGVAGADFTPAVAADLAGRFAASMPARARVVLGRDERRVHEAFISAVAAALREAGCDVLHLGPALQPTVQFAVRQSGAGGGLWLAAPDRPAGHAGLIPFGAGGRPWGEEERAALPAATARRDPVAGRDRTCGAAAEHETSLWPAFRTLSALRVTLESPSAAVRERFDRLFAALPDELETLDSSVDSAPGVIRETMGESAGDVRLSVDSSSARCREFAPSGEPVSWAGTVRTLAADAVRRAANRANPPTVAVAAALADELRLKIAAAGGRVREVEDRPEALWDAVADGCALAAGTGGRIVFATPHGPAADAALALAALLRAAANGSARASR